MRVFAAVALPGLIFAAALPARGAFHVAHISEVMTSLNGDASVQFVEIEMAAAGQTITTDSVLGAFAADGNYLGDILVVPSNLSNAGAGVSWLMATAEFAAVTGLDPDFVFPAGLPTESGMVCWGAPGSVPPDPGSWSHSDPDQYVDCIAYGDYGGQTALGSGAQAFGSPDGHSLQRISDTGDNETDFACGDPATPTSNDGMSDDVGASSPCLISECGDGVPEGAEECDDGNTVAGDGCDDTCQFEATCGNGILEGNETCDDGNTVDGDGCSSVCLFVFTEVPTKGQQACVNELNKRFAGVLKARNKVAFKCLKNFAKGREADFPACAFGDDPQVAKAKSKTTRGEQKKCANVDFAIGLGGASAANDAADQQAIAALGDVLGNPPNPALKAEADLARCQAEVTKNLGRIEDALAKALNKAKKGALRGKSIPQVASPAELAAVLGATFGDPKVARTAAKAVGKINGRCPAGDLSAIFPGVCDATSASALANCTSARARCRVCLAFEAADQLDLDCDAASGVACPGP